MKTRLKIKIVLTFYCLNEIALKLMIICTLITSKMLLTTKLAGKQGSGETRPKTVSGFNKVANFGN